MTVRIADAVSRMPRPPLALVAGLLALACFGFALLAGWLTAGTDEQLRRPGVVDRGTNVRATPLFGPAAALPPPPKRAATASAAPKPVIPKVIVGSG